MVVCIFEHIQWSPAERARLEDVRLVRPELLAEELKPEWGEGGREAAPGQ
jgi:hypothetical protein